MQPYQTHGLCKAHLVMLQGRLPVQLHSRAAVQVQLLLQKIRELGAPSGKDKRISVKYGLLFRCALT